MRGEGEPVNLTKLKNLLAPSVYSWQRNDAPPGTELEIRHDFVRDKLMFCVNDAVVDTIGASDLDGCREGHHIDPRLSLAKHRMLARAWELEREMAPLRASAGERSEVLLRRHLTATQDKSLTDNGYFEIDGGQTGHVYRIHANVDKNIGRNVELLINGQPIACYNAKPHRAGRELPWGDVVLSQKLALETDESAFLKVACVAPMVDGHIARNAGYAGYRADTVIIDDPYGQYNELRGAIEGARHQIMNNLAQHNPMREQLALARLHAGVTQGTPRPYMPMRHVVVAGEVLIGVGLALLGAVTVFMLVRVLS